MVPNDTSTRLAYLPRPPSPTLPSPSLKTGAKGHGLSRAAGRAIIIIPRPALAAAVPSYVEASAASPFTDNPVEVRLAASEQEYRTARRIRTSFWIRCRPAGRDQRLKPLERGIAAERHG